MFANSVQSISFSFNRPPILQKKFSELLNVPYTQLNEILNGKRPVTTDFALMMEAALGINPELLINMQSRYNMLH